MNIYRTSNMLGDRRVERKYQTLIIKSNERTNKLIDINSSERTFYAERNYAMA